MNNATKIIIAVVLVAVVAVGAIMLTGDKLAEESADTASGTGKTTAVTYTSSGLSPSEVMLKAGDSLKIINDTNEEIEPSSNPHPVHTDNPELNFGDIEAGESKTVTLTTKGTWGYHNHYHKDHGATIVVE